MVEEVREGDYKPIVIHCHHQNHFYTKVGSDDNDFNVSLIVRDKVTETVSTEHNF